MRDNASSSSSSSSSSSMRRSGKEKVAPSSSKGKKGDLLHIERVRREKMNEYYTMLQSMVPNLFPRATRARIIDETISYIRSLEEVIITLDSRKMAMGMQTQRSPTISLTVSGKTAFFGLRALSRPGLVTRVMQVFDEHKAEVLAATAAGEEDGCISVITVTALLSQEEENGAERIKAELMAM